MGKSARKCIWLCCLLVCSCDKSDDGPRLVKKATVQSHADQLRAGDFHAGGGSIPSRTPYHLQSLIEAGPAAAPVLIGLLEDDTMTPFTYHQQMEFSLSVLSYGEERQATIGDLADYALRVIFDIDAGYRSYLEQVDRESAIAKWKQLAREKGDRK